MSKYKVIRREHIFGVWFIEANSMEEAEEKWEAMRDNDEIDYSDMELYDSEDEFLEV